VTKILIATKPKTKGRVQDKSRQKKEGNRKKQNVKPTERGLGPNGGGWNIAQASAWSGIGENSLREVVKSEKPPFPVLFVGRRILIPRHAFMEWFNSQGESAA
jgi:hypothetical protein